MPERIQQHRTAGWRKPTGARSVAAPTPWANPWRPAVEPFAAWLDAPTRDLRHLLANWNQNGLADPPRHKALIGLHASRTSFITEAQETLAGADLMCWCPPHRPCHADILLELVNDLPDQVWIVPIGTTVAKVSAPTLTRAAIAALRHLERVPRHSTAGRVLIEEIQPRVPTEKELENINWSLVLSSKTPADRKHYLVRERTP